MTGEPLRRKEIKLLINNFLLNTDFPAGMDVSAGMGIDGVTRMES